MKHHRPTLGAAVAIALGVGVAWFGTGRDPGEAPAPGELATSSERSPRDREPPSSGARRESRVRARERVGSPAALGADDGVLTVRVLDVLDGGPVPRATLEWTSGSGGTGSGTTGSEGEVRFDGVPLESVQVRLIRLDGGAPLDEASRSVTLRPDAASVEVVLRAVRDRDVQVVVLDLDDQTVPEVEVRIERDGVGPLRTNARGRATYRGRVRDVVTVDEAAELTMTLEHLREGRARLRLPKRTGDASDDEAAEVVALPGQVLWASTGEGVEGAWVVARRTARDTPVETRTDADGRFILRYVPDPRFPHRVEARHDVYGVAAATVGEPRPKRLILELESGGSIEGRVTDSRGRPAPVFRVRHGKEGRGAEIDWLGVETFADPEGRFEIEALVPGAYTVEASTEDQAPTRARGIDVPEGGVGFATIQLDDPGALEGVVLDRETRAPVPGARLRIEGFGGTSEARADEGGRFHLDGLAPGRRSLVAEADGYRDRIVSALDIRSGETAGPVTVDLAPTADEDPGVDLVGIGAVLETGAGGGLEVKQLIPGGGASEVGLRVGEVITEVDGQSVDELGFDGAVQALRGREGTAVQIRVEGEGGSRSMSISRRLVST